MDLGTKLGVAGLLVTTIGLIGLVALWPSLRVSPQPPLDPAQPFSVPFQITNASYVPVCGVTVSCYAHRVKVGGMTMQSCLMSNRGWTATRLGRGESMTVIPNLVQAPVLPGEADIVIAVNYGLVGVPFSKLRHFTRFVGHFGASWQWLQQPSKEIQADATRMIDGKPPSPRSFG